MYQHLFSRVAVCFAFAVAVPSLASANQFKNAQNQTREPPLSVQPPVPPPPPPPPLQQPAQPPVQPPPPPPPGPQQPINQQPIIQQPVPIRQPVPIQQPVPIRQPVPMPCVPGPVVLPPGPAIVEVPCPPVDPPAPLVKIRVRVAACAPAGQEIEYVIRVENCSPALAHHVLVRNPLPCNCRFVRAAPAPTAMDPDIVWALGSLSSGEKREIILVLTPTDSSDVKNCARVQFEHGECVVTRIAQGPPTFVEPTKEMEMPKAPEPPMQPAQPTQPMEPPEEKEQPKVQPSGAAQVSMKITGPAKQYANLPAKYQITVTNTGDASAGNLLLTAFLPEKSVFLGVSDNGRFHYHQVAWLLGNLPAGASKTVQVTYKMSVAGEACLKASALADANVKGETEVCTDFEGTSALLLETVDTKDPVEVGGNTSYRIILFNQGTVDLTNINVQVLVPRELALVRATGPTSPPAPGQLPAAVVEGQPMSFATLKQLKTGEKQVYEVFAKAVRAGDARWKTVLTADQLSGGSVTEEESTTIFREDQPLHTVPLGPPQPQSLRAGQRTLQPSPPRSIQSFSQSASVISSMLSMSRLLSS